MFVNKVTPIYQWTNGSEEVLIVRFANKDGKSSSKRLGKNGQEISAEPFQHPMVVGETVTAEDWTPKKIAAGVSTGGRGLCR